MRIRFIWLLLAGALLGAPSTAFGQDVPPVLFTGPLSHPRYEEGGFFVGLEGLFWRETRPLKNQVIATRGVIDVDGSLTGNPGSFIGSGDVALNTSQLRGPGSYQPGFDLTLGWRFESGTVLQFSWYHLVDARYGATATLLPPGFKIGSQLENTFLTSPVVNFPVDFAGFPNNLSIGNPGATFGIWNAATLMTIDFIQRFDMFDTSMRIPMWQTENFRTYGMIGPRIISLWERFKWRTVDADVNGGSGPGTTADYTNITSNRLYGVNFGCGNEWFMGDTPVGAFSISLDVGGSAYVDFVKGRAAYELEDRSIGVRRARRMWTIAPELEAKLKCWWYPWEGIQVQVGYDFMAFFNTMASPEPVDFNYASVDPQWNSTFIRWFHGWTFGVGFVF